MSSSRQLLPAAAIVAALFVGLPFMGSTAGGATVIFVDDDNCPGPGSGTQADPYCSIQAAISAAVAGDEIVVAPGTYFETINFLGKAITARSSDGAAVTTIDAQLAGPVVSCISGEGLDTVLDGFTITGGMGGLGGGMSNIVSSPTVTNCTFSGNTGGLGGGMGNLLSSPTVTNCTFSGNTASLGGGMGNIIDGSPTVTNCTFSGNSADFGGGMDNLASSTPLMVTNCTFSGNTATSGGGMRNAGISSLTVTNCTFSGNSATSGGGMRNDSISSLTVTNCILWGDSPDEIFTSSGTATVTFSDVQGGFPGTGNIDADPLFVDPGSGDLRLSSGSPCIDAADNTAVPADTEDLDGDEDTAEPLPFDLDGDPRFVDDPGVADTGIGPAPVVDMGALERQEESEMIEFEEPEPVPAAGEPVFEATGDLDGDGDIDVVVAIPDLNPMLNGSVQVFLNQGTDPVTGEWLGLVPNMPVTVGREPTGVAVGLFNADLHLDVAVTNAGDNTLSILYNKGFGDGSLFDPVVIPVGNRPSAVVAADFNLDTFVDLAVTNKLDSNVMLILNADFPPPPPPGGGGGAVAAVPFATFPTGGQAFSLVTDDFDGNKRPDMAGTARGTGLTGATGLVFVLLGLGDGTFEPVAVHSIGLDPLHLATADLQEDGAVDIVAVNSGDATVSILLNQLDGTFGPASTLPVGLNPRSIDAVDLDGDGDSDLAVVADDPVIGPSVQVLANRIDQGGGLVFEDPVAFSVDADPNFVVTADFNGDGALDLMTVNADEGETGGSVTVLLNSPPAFAGLLVSLDIKPGSCPNPLNRTSPGVLPVALVGSEDFDVSRVDLGTVVLERAAGIGGSVAPLQGPPGPSSVIEDVATPFDGELCDCHELEGDGLLDLSMKFRTQDLVEQLQLTGLPGGTFVAFVVSGTLVDGTPFSASDCVKLVPPSDSDGDGVVGAADLLLLLGAWGPCTAAQECLADLDEDGSVGISDLLMLLANWG